MPISDLPAAILCDYEAYEWRHASAILVKDFPSEWKDIIDVLGEFRLRRSAVTTGGGGKSKVSGALDSEFVARGWREKKFLTQIKVDDDISDSPTHKVDCFKNRIALEIEWNNKDPFFDRDLNNFRLLFDLRVVSVGVIVTRADHLQDLFEELDVGTKYGPSTTHMSKLLPRIRGGGGAGCPLLVFGIKRELYVDDQAQAAAAPAANG